MEHAKADPAANTVLDLLAQLIYAVQPQSFHSKRLHLSQGMELFTGVYFLTVNTPMPV